MNVTLSPLNNDCYIMVQAVNFRIRNAVLVLSNLWERRRVQGNACCCIPLESEKKKRNHPSFIYLYSEAETEGVTGGKAGNTNAASGDLNRNGGPLTSEQHLMDSAFIVSAVRVCLYPVAVQSSGGSWRRRTREKWRSCPQGEFTLYKFFFIIIIFYVINQVDNKAVIHFYIAKASFSIYKSQFLILFSQYFIVNTYLMYLHSQGVHRNRIQMMTYLFYKRETEEEALFFSDIQYRSRTASKGCPLL